MGYGLWVITNYELRITNYELRITNYELRITNYELRMGNNKSLPPLLPCSPAPPAL